MKRRTGRIVIAFIFVVALHLTLLAFVLTRHDAVPMVRSSPAVTIQLLRMAENPRATQSIQVTRTAHLRISEPVYTSAPPYAVVAPTKRVNIMPPRIASSVSDSSAKNGATGMTRALSAGSGMGREQGKSGSASSSASGSGSAWPKNVTHVDCFITAPDYPDAARSRGESGTADVHFIIERSGKISHIKLRKSSGFPRLDAAALAATRRSSCRPYLENGKAVRVAATKPFRFGLKTK